MRKLLSFLFSLVIATQTCFAQVVVNEVHFPQVHRNVVEVNKIHPTVLEQLLSYGGLTFFADYSDIENDNNADYSLGSPLNTLTVARSSTYPATYWKLVDGTPQMQVTTTSNVARKSDGYFDETGWHYDPHWLIEGQSTNYCLNSYFSLDTNADGVGDSWTVASPGVGTLETCAVNGLPSGKSQKAAVTFVSDPAQYYTTMPTFTANDTFNASAANITVTASFWARGDLSGLVTGDTQNHWVHLDARDNAGDWQQSIANETLATGKTKLSSTEWRRFSLKGTITDTDTRKVNLAFIYLPGATRPLAGESGWIEVYGVQIEKQLYPSSFIPTTTAALTRNAETTNAYTTASNFPAPSGGNCLSFDGASASGDDYVSVPNSATGNQAYGATALSGEVWFLQRSSGEGSYGRWFDKGNATTITSGFGMYGNGNALAVVFGNGTTEVINRSTTTYANNVYTHGVFSLVVGEKPKLYLNGAEVAYNSNVAITTIPDDSANALIIGNCLTSGLRTFDGCIQCVRIYRNKALSAADVTALYNAGRGTAIANIPSVTGCTAEYLFNEGTGTTLTDTIAANNGTISGATWSKDTYSGTILLKYKPIMMPNEQSGGYSRLFEALFGNSSNRVAIIYGNNASNSLALEIKSNDSSYSASKNLAWDRYSSITFIASWSNIANDSSEYIVGYINGIKVAQKTSNFCIPAGNLSSTFTIQSSAGQAMGLQELAVWNRVLTQAEVTQIQNRS